MGHSFNSTFNKAEMNGNDNDIFATNTSEIVTVTVPNTAISYVSSLPSAFILNDVVIVILGIGKYDSGLHNLPGVKKDYDNIIDTFVKYWKYKVLYKTSNMNVVYNNDINIIDKNRNYKLYWTCDDIELFVEQARQHVVKNKHNGMIFVISSHGDVDKTIYDSNLERYELEDIFKLFSPQWGLFLESYKETKDESNHLFQIPKIFCIDCCRGDAIAKLTKVTDSKRTTDEKEELDDGKQPASSDKDVKQKQAANVLSKSALAVVGNEKFGFKSISKNEGKKYSAQMANFCKLWANVEGFSVADGSENGGLFLRNISRIFKDRKFIDNHQ